MPSLIEIEKTSLEQKQLPESSILWRINSTKKLLFGYFSLGPHEKRK